MPESAGILIGLAGGIVATLVGIYYGEWLRDRRQRRRVGAELIAKARVLLSDAAPTPLALVAVATAEEAWFKLLWRRWVALREPFLTFVVDSPPAVRESGHRAAYLVAATISLLLRGAKAEEAGARQAAVDQIREQHEAAVRALDDLADALNRRSWRPRLAARRSA